MTSPTSVSVAGLDWSTSPEKRALVTLSLSDSELFVSGVNGHKGVSDDEVVQTCKSPALAVVAADVPFGWPVAFSDFVREWTPRGGFRDTIPNREKFCYRRTDQIIKDRGLASQPFSVSSDRIGVSARFWAVLLQNHDLHSQIDVGDFPLQSGPRPVLIEVYPRASLSGFNGGEKFRDYKTNRTVRQQLVDTLWMSFGIKANEPTKGKIVGNHNTRSDETDAFIAALTALVYYHPTNGYTVHRPQGEREREFAAREGWIFFPIRQ